MSDLDAIDELDLSVLAHLDQRAHDHPLLLPGGHHGLPRHVGPGQVADDGRQPLPRPGEQLEHLDQVGGGIEGREEAGEDEPAVGAPREAHARFGGGVHQRRGGELGAADPDAVL